VLLPATSWAETEGTYTSSSNHVQLARQAVAPAAQARPAWEVLYRLALELGLEQEREVTPRVLFSEMAAEISAYSGMTWGRLLSGAPLAAHREVPGVD
jgi:predicted molibdopterin-dependent oxidoreductase YjgC